jgi:azurin
MNFNKIALGFSLVSGLALAGCGNGVSDDPLAGTWSNNECFGSASEPADIESCSSELTFTNELDVELRADWISLAATATHPGCTTTKRVTGQQWSAEHAADTFTVTGNGAATMERTDCVNKDDDIAAATTTDISIPSGDTKYAISGDTLTVQSGSLKGTYTR